MSFLVPFVDDDPFYRRSWRSPLGQLSRLDDQMFDVGGMLNSLERDVASLARQFGCPAFGNSGGGLDVLSPAVVSHVEGTEGGDGKYVVNVPLGKNIGPDDLKVGVKDNVMTIEAKKEQKSEDGNCRMYQEYVRKFTLPPNVNAKEVKSVLTPEGYLKVEAPMPKQLEQNQQKQVTEKPNWAVQEKKPCPIPIHMK